MLDRVGDALALADGAEGLRRLAGVQQDLLSGPCYGLPEAAPLVGLVNALVAGGQRHRGAGQRAAAHAALSQQRSGSLGPPTKFARALTLSASQV